MSDIKAFPLDNTDYLAEDLRKWLYTRTTGVYSAENNLAVKSNDNMTVTVTKGIAFLNDGTGGLVSWNDVDTIVQVPIADNMLDRIDSIVLRWDKAQNKTMIDLVRGDLGENPKAKAPTRDSNCYEIVLAKINVTMGTGAITADKIEDTRLDETVCGLMRDGVTSIPTQQLYDQFTTWVKTLRGKLNEETAGHLQNQIDEIHETRYPNPNLLVNADWSDDDLIINDLESSFVLGSNAIPCINGWKAERLDGTKEGKVEIPFGEHVQLTNVRMMQPINFPFFRKTVHTCTATIVTDQTTISFPVFPPDKIDRDINVIYNVNNFALEVKNTAIIKGIKVECGDSFTGFPLLDIAKEHEKCRKVWDIVNLNGSPFLMTGKRLNVKIDKQFYSLFPLGKLTAKILSDMSNQGIEICLNGTKRTFTTVNKIIVHQDTPESVLLMMDLNGDYQGEAWGFFSPLGDNRVLITT